MRFLFILLVLVPVGASAATGNYTCTVSHANKPGSFTEVASVIQISKVNTPFTTLFESNEILVSFSVEPVTVDGKVTERVMSVSTMKKPLAGLPETQASAPENTSVGLYDYRNGYAIDCR
jgi:hypothetical protein